MKVNKLVRAVQGQRMFQTFWPWVALSIGAAENAKTAPGVDDRVDNPANLVAVLEQKLQESERLLQVRSGQLQPALDRLERIESRVAPAEGGTAVAAAVVLLAVQANEDAPQSVVSMPDQPRKSVARLLDRIAPHRALALDGQGDMWPRELTATRARPL